MELDDSGQPLRSCTRSGSFIDLNEDPSSSASSPPALLDSDFRQLTATYAFNCFMRKMSIPSELCELACSVCELPEVREDALVCDACERGFHLQCAGFKNIDEPTGMNDWICINCSKAGAMSRRWPLGVKRRRILDINSSPPSDVEFDSAVHSYRSWVMDHADLKNIGYRDTGDKTVPIHSADADYITAHKILNDTECSINRRVGRDEDVVRESTYNLSDIFLENLKKFVSERHGILENGWSVKFKCSSEMSYNPVTYCSPDGTTFESMLEIASYLGLSKNQIDVEVKTEGSLRRPAPDKLPKKRKLRDNVLVNGHPECNKISLNGFHKVSFFNDHFMPKRNSVDTIVVDVKDGADAKDSFVFDVEPVQFEDYFILSFGRVDCRPSYHCTDAVWPVGFKSMWRDKVTRSLFTCEILDGGDGGPLFAVKRFPCSALLIPSVRTAILPSKIMSCVSRNGELLNRGLEQHVERESEETIEAILKLYSSPTESDILSCLSDSAFQNSSSSFKYSSNTYHEDKIGEIHVEERSTSKAWKLMAQKLVNAFTECFQLESQLNLFHTRSDAIFPYWLNKSRTSDRNCDSLLKFSSNPSLFGTPIVHNGDYESLSPALMKWLSVDRFGLDVEFVQEILEHFLEVDSCSKYQNLKKRCQNYEASTVSNQRLVAKCCFINSGESYYSKKKPDLLEESVVRNHGHPSSSLLLSKLSKKSVGDLYQVWEILFCLHKLLGIEEPLSLDQLENEVIHFGYDGLTTENSTKINSLNSGSNSLGKHELVEHTSSSSISPSVYDNHLYTESGNDNASADDRVPSLNYALCFGELLTKVHCTVLQILIRELLSKTDVFVNPNFYLSDSKSKKERKKNIGSSVEHESRLNLLPLNELTWPELSRRYILAFLAMGGAPDSSDGIVRETGRVYCCLGGDGGQLCGAATKVAGMEADALFLAEATKQVFSSISRKNIFIAEEQLNRSLTECERETREACELGTIPEWAQLLEPVRKLPTNVGTRIRKCVQDALEKRPPEWAKKRLEHSISKDVYKGNASGPTKKAVLAVLSEVHNEESQPKTETVKNNIVVHVDEILMKQCRSVLRRAAAMDEDKKFCTLLGRIIVSCGEQTDEGLLGVPAMVPRPLDFRTIDYRLSVGAYCGFHESFHEDVLELRSNVQSAFGDRLEILEVVQKVFERFEYLFETEVVPLAHKLQEYTMLDSISKEIRNDVKNIVEASNNLPKAPWDEGLCKVCGVDRDDNSVLLCDSCDAEYHTYCLDPPLEKIPEGNWYCLACTHEIRFCKTSKHGKENDLRTHINFGEITSSRLDNIPSLVALMQEKDYWDFNSNEKISLLKFLTDELLNSTMIKKHLEHCSEISSDLQMQLRAFSNEWKNLRSQMEFLSTINQKSDDVPIELQGSKSSVIGQDDHVFNGDCKEMLEEHKLLDDNASITTRKKDDELNAMKDRISQLQNHIKKLELELLNLALRRVFLGCDSKGHFYWASVTPDNHPSIVVNCNPPLILKNSMNMSMNGDYSNGQCPVVPEGSNVRVPFLGDDKNTSSLGSWDFFHTDAEVEQLVCCLKDDDIQEKLLKESILKWRQSKYQYHANIKNLHHGCVNDYVNVGIKNETWHNLTTKGMSFLEKKIGKFDYSSIHGIFNKDGKSRLMQEVKAYRCSCLEPIWSSRFHCHSCHRTFGKNSELAKHNNENCQMPKNEPIADDVGEDYSTGMQVVPDKEFRDGPPFDFELVSTKFTTQDCLKNLIQGIGLFDSPGISTLLSSLSPVVNESLQLLTSLNNGTYEHHVTERAEKATGIADTQTGVPSINHSQKLAVGSSNSKDNDQSLNCVKYHRYTAAQSSLLPVSREASKVFRLLKINLLDMESALCEEGFKRSHGEGEKRLAWRSFVKSAVSVYQMVQATVLFEEMISSQFLSCERWHWSSFSAAAKTSTISALALRIFSLDAAILYEKCRCYPQKTVASSGSREKCNVSKKYSRKSHTEG